MLLNLDAGEHPDEPDELWGLADVLCVACGGHAGDEASMTRVVTFIAAHPHIALGAHPSYPDRAGFGRTTPDDFDPMTLVAQCRWLAEIAARHGVPVRYIKPHGALYHDAAKDPSLAELVARIGRSAFGDDVAVIGPGGLREVFADRAVRPDGSLVPRSEPGAVITDPAAAAARAKELVAAGDAAILCCHADTPGALAIVRAVRAVLR